MLRIAALLFLTGLSGFQGEGPYEALLPGGDWKSEGMVQLVKGVAGKKSALSLVGAQGSFHAKAVQKIFLPTPHPDSFTIGFLVKGDIQAHDKKKEEGQAVLSLLFFDSKEKKIEKPVELGSWQGSFGWSIGASHVQVPREARQFTLTLELRAAEGSVLFDNMKLLWNGPDEYDRMNQVVDGDFEFPNPFSAWSRNPGAKIRYPGHQSHGFLELFLKNPKDSALATQVLAFDDNGPKDREAFLEFSFKLNQIEARKENGGARLEIHFWDEHRRRVDSPFMLGSWTGSKPWTRWKGRVPLPENAKGGVLRLVMEEASGTAFFDRIRFSLRAGKKSVPRPLESRTDTRGWKAFHAKAISPGGLFDSSFLLDKPAGRHGFLKAGSDGHFYFDDGTPARFFGLNLQGPSALPSHQDARLLSERLAQMGVNIVRLHHLDAPHAKPNLFDPAFDDTQHFSKESLDRLDYFIDQLKSRGIYIYLDLLVHRRFKAGDGVRDFEKLARGAKAVAQFNPRLIELQKKYARDLLTHHNPYTKRRLLDEPAIVLMEIINESSLFRMEKVLDFIPPSYHEELQGLWVAYLRKKGATDPESQAHRYLDGKDQEVQHFYAEVQRHYFETMRDYLRELGVKIPVAGSNFALGGWDLETNAALDFIDRHAYWDPPQGGYGDFVRFHNALLTEEVHVQALTADPKRVNPVTLLSREKVSGKPLMVSEWNIPWPNESRAVGPLIMLAYSHFQDWDGLIQFNHEGNLLPERVEGNFDVSSKPEIFLQFPVLSRLFHRLDIKTARSFISFPILFKGEIPPAAGLVQGLLRTQEGAIPSLTEFKGPWMSDTGEIQWDAVKGTVIINAPHLQAAIGRTGSEPVRLKSVIFEIKTPVSAVALTSLDDAPVENSERLFLVTVARSENTGTVYNATRTSLKESGRSPILMEPVLGSMTLLQAKRSQPLKVYAIDAGGDRGREIPVEEKAGSVVIPLGEAPVYEIVSDLFNLPKDGKEG